MTAVPPRLAKTIRTTPSLRRRVAQRITARGETLSAGEECPDPVDYRVGQRPEARPAEGVDPSEAADSPRPVGAPSVAQLLEAESPWERARSAPFAWGRAPGSSVADALNGERLAWRSVGEPQGEAIAFSSDGLSYFTISEGEEQQLFQFSCEQGH